MTVGADDHCGLLNLLRIVGLDRIDDIKAAQGCETAFPDDLGAFALDLLRHGCSELPEFPRLSEQNRQQDSIHAVVSGLGLAGTE